MTYSRKNNSSRDAFTLVEMLVVVVIILVLLGVVFKMVRPASEHAAKAQTANKLAKVAAAIEEFYAEYGQYPPVPVYSENVTKEDNIRQPIFFERLRTSGMSPNLVSVIAEKSTSEAPVFVFGLLSFLMDREGRDPSDDFGSMYTISQWTKYNSSQEGDRKRDDAVVDRIRPFLEGITRSDIRVRKVSGGAGQEYTNSYTTVLDAWERNLVYISPPPHQTYILFSKGPDGKFDEDYPEDRDRPKNKDNIYADVGF
jgi:prepilin-type N-terminal cleavage/methylation domain-containing protein